VLAAINLGLALATKHLGLFALVVAVAGTTLIMRRTGRSAAAAIAAAALLAIASLTLPLPWYARSWMATGNPVFPEFHRVFGAPAERWDAAADDALNRYEAQFGRPRTLISMLALPWDLSIHAARYGGTVGPLFLILLPALLIRGPGVASTRTLAALAAGYALLWASPLSNFQIRFLIPVSPLLSVLAADAYSRLDQCLRDQMRARHVLIAGTTALLLLNLPPNLPLHERDRVGFSGWLTHVIDRIPVGVVTGRQTEDRYLRSTVRSYGGWRYINAHLPETSLVLTFTGGDNLYSMRPRLWANSVVARPATWGAPPGADVAALRTLRRLRVTHILFDKIDLRTTGAHAFAIAQSSFLARWARREYEDQHVALYSLHWD
jgi:hypothetical protein